MIRVHLNAKWNNGQLGTVVQAANGKRENSLELNNCIVAIACVQARQCYL
jgi:hypothetical protein